MHFEPITYSQSKIVGKYETPTDIYNVIKMSAVILYVSDVMVLVSMLF